MMHGPINIRHTMSHVYVSVHFIHFPSTLNEPVQVRFIVAGCLDNEVFITKALESVLNDSCVGILHLQLLCSVLSLRYRQ